jgi:hypothetical protein
MRFYTKLHRFYCGIDLHARSMYLCILNQDGDVLLHRNMKTDPALVRSQSTRPEEPVLQTSGGLLACPKSIPL